MPKEKVLKPQSLVIALLCLIGTTTSLFANPPAASFYSRINNATFESNGTWSSTGHSGSSSGSNPGCAINGNVNIYIADTVISYCTSMLINGNVDFVIESGGFLELQGDMEIYGNATFDIEDGGALSINGDLDVSGSGELILDGDLTVTGDITLSGSGEICGTGSANIGGSVSGSGFCYSISVLPVELIDFSAEVTADKEVELVWSTAVEIDNDYFLLERSNNGMTFQEIARIEGAGNSNQEQSYRFTDQDLATGTYYYRLTQVDHDGDEEAFEMIAASVYRNDQSDICELKVYPNPCVPACNIDLENCPGEVFRTYLLDGSGRMISELVPISTHNDKKIQYHLNKENFMMPGVYIIRSESEAATATKKLIIK